MSALSYHKLLKGQMRKFLNEDGSCPNEEAFRSFLEAVNSSYNAFEQDKELSQRMFDIADSEYQEINSRLLEEKKTREQSIAKLIDAVRTLRQEEGASDLHENLDLLAVADLLNEEVMLRRQIEDALKEAIVEKVRNEDFDLVLMDLQMPMMDGREATEKIREFDTELPIIALTASTNESTRREVLALGMSDFAGKPFEPDHLYRKLKSHILPKEKA